MKPHHKVSLGKVMYDMLTCEKFLPVCKKFIIQVDFIARIYVIALIYYSLSKDIYISLWILRLFMDFSLYLKHVIYFYLIPQGII